MHVLMLGWEFPPYITGGLGTACHGLTRALDQHGVRVTFVLPRPVGDPVDVPAGRAVGDADTAQIRLLSPGGTGSAAGPRRPWPARPAPNAAACAEGPPGTPPAEAFERTTFLTVPSRLVHPYRGAGGDRPVSMMTTETTPVAPAGAPAEPPITMEAFAGAAVPPAASPPAPANPASPRGDAEYGHDLLGEAERYAAFCLDAAADLDFDVIHAHDWLTYPAGLWIARMSGRPLVVHVHSTEFDRSGEHVNQPIYDIERRGMHGATRVIAVSQLTRDVITRRYAVPAAQVDVVYNGVEFDPRSVGVSEIRRRDKIVLYFGRITFQKGPEYFVRAAKRVLEYIEDVKFVVAGSGDQARSMIEMAADLGIGHKVLFTGFLRGDDIRRVFELADLYVMPSVSEPFGIAPLEAMSHDVPVLISNTSGVSEVLTHVLKVDFWDVDDMANKIIAVLRHPPLGQMLRTHGKMEVRQLTWEGAAGKCEAIYEQVIRAMAAV